MEIVIKIIPAFKSEVIIIDLPTNFKCSHNGLTAFVGEMTTSAIELLPTLKMS